MIVCLCHRVSDRDIARATREGCTSFDELQLELAVATSCGRCHDCARDTFDHHSSQLQAKAHAGASAVCASGEFVTTPSVCTTPLVRGRTLIRMAGV